MEEEAIEDADRPAAEATVPAAQRPRGAGPVVVIGTSAGGLRALEEVLGGLPADFGAPVVVVLHLDPHHRSMVADILSRHTSLATRAAAHGEPLEPGTVTLAVPDHHLVIDDGERVALTQTPQVRFSRPSIDLLFASAARVLGPRAIAVVLTGTGSDGADGVRAVHEAGGRVVAQDPASAEFAAMPQAAIDTDQVDTIVPLAAVASTLVDLAASMEPS